MAFKMKGPSLYKNSPIKQDKMAKVSQSKKSKVNLPYKNLTEVNGEYSYNDGDGKITLTKSEYLTAKKENAKYSQ